MFQDVCVSSSNPAWAVLQAAIQRRISVPRGVLLFVEGMTSSEQFAGPHSGLFSLIQVDLNIWLMRLNWGSSETGFYCCCWEQWSPQSVQLHRPRIQVWDCAGGFSVVPARITSSKMPPPPEKPPYSFTSWWAGPPLVPLNSTSIFPMLRLGPKILTPGSTSVLSGLILRTVLLIWLLPALSEAVEHILFPPLAPGVGHLWQSIGLRTKVEQSEAQTGRT